MANQQIRNKIDEFVTELEQLVRQAAVQTVEDALGGAAPSRRKIAVSNGSPRARGAKRDPAYLENMVDNFVSYVRSNPGQGIEAINKALGLSSKELSLPVKKAIAAGSVKTEGQKRATKYFPAGRTKAAARPRVAKAARVARSRPKKVKPRKKAKSKAKKRSRR